MAAFANALTGAAKGAGSAKDEDDLDWFEKDLEDFVIEDKTQGEHEEEEDLANIKGIQFLLNM